MEEPFTKSLNSIRSLQAVKAVIAADHEGFHHAPYDWWLFVARVTSPKTCDVCSAMNGLQYRGDRVPEIFQYHTHQQINVIRANVHPHCRCTLRWVGRTNIIYETPLGLLSPQEARQIWMPSEKELEHLSPSELQMILEFLSNPWS